MGADQALWKPAPPPFELSEEEIIKWRKNYYSEERVREEKEKEEKQKKEKNEKDKKEREKEEKYKYEKEKEEKVLAGAKQMPVEENKNVEVESKFVQENKNIVEGIH